MSPWGSLPLEVFERCSIQWQNGKLPAIHYTLINSQQGLVGERSTPLTMCQFHFHLFPFISRKEKSREMEEEEEKEEAEERFTRQLVKSCMVTHLIHSSSPFNVWYHHQTYYYSTFSLGTEWFDLMNYQPSTKERRRERRSRSRKTWTDDNWLEFLSVE